MKLTKQTKVWVINLEDTKNLAPKSGLKVDYCGKNPINVFSQGLETKVSTYLKCVEVCRFVWPDVEGILTASTDKECDINILPVP